MSKIREQIIEHEGELPPGTPDTDHWIVYTQKKTGAPFKWAGSLNAPDTELAVQFAGEPGEPGLDEPGLGEPSLQRNQSGEPSLANPDWRTRSPAGVCYFGIVSASFWGHVGIVPKTYWK